MKYTDLQPGALVRVMDRDVRDVVCEVTGTRIDIPGDVMHAIEITGDESHRAEREFCFFPSGIIGQWHDHYDAFREIPMRLGDVVLLEAA